MEINLIDIEKHKQLTQGSCVPMSVECVLKLLKLMPEEDFSFQEDDTKAGNSNWVLPFLNYPTINPKVQFKREFHLSDFGQPDRGQHFMDIYFGDLFKTID